ncbi:BON domain-containing protein [Chelatococcus asaccharovorans]|uniref:Osmotically-inducible protein OsmY n=1 Tax=Chelatococcus asaccharovorans TaxID=28210 RepID=A0A2V3TVD7_9HYPH|nr:BON domain-containing protein [Chelatococcus asaccharovorans]MBS7706071.1 BON domain-containing protein [Chelatococcus asaccharovorans]PXW52440.1 osmotically-inducible protein OsmY [Chelatococcus asaccharovorans]CAH1659849.1 Osmotically-inducible protein OsmY [Chelatococcus asaccharovorans]CAH1684037.1 Osmotically-inducible protein OsmY [Chelatococcus asaccharovorans]
MSERDLGLRQDVLDELEFEPSIDAADIGVTVKDGVVTLIGHVRSYAEKIAAERAVQRVKGVRAIAQELEVRYPERKKTADDEIAKRALAIISWDTTIPDDVIQVKVQAGWITLSGEVDWHFQKRAVEDAVRKLTGVVGVTNLLLVRPRIQADDVKHRIEEALKRNAAIEAGTIRVGVSGGKVTLAGQVHAWYERGVAERAAWAVPGVTAVEDHLVIR